MRPRAVKRTRNAIGRLLERGVTRGWTTAGNIPRGARWIRRIRTRTLLNPPCRMSCTDFCRELGSLRKFLPDDSSLIIDFARMSSLIPASCPPSRSGFPGSRAPTPERAADDARISSFRLSPRDDDPGRPGRGSMWRVNTPRVESDDNCVAQRERFRSGAQPELPIWSVEQIKCMIPCQRKRRLFARFQVPFKCIDETHIVTAAIDRRKTQIHGQDVGRRRFRRRDEGADATIIACSSTELRNTTRGCFIYARVSAATRAVGETPISTSSDSATGRYPAP